MPFRKFRVFDVKEDCLVNDNLAIGADGTLLVYEIDLTTGIDDDSFKIQFATGLTDAAGAAIYDGDTLHLPHSGQDSATMKKDGYDYLVGFCKYSGQWFCYENIGGRLMKHTALFKMAKKGTIVKEKMP